MWLDRARAARRSISRRAFASSQHFRHAFTGLFVAFASVLRRLADAPVHRALEPFVLWLRESRYLTADQALTWPRQGMRGAVVSGTPDEILATASVLLSRGMKQNFACIDVWPHEPSPEDVRAVTEAAHSMCMAGVVFGFTAFPRDDTTFSADSTPLALESPRTAGRAILLPK